MKISNIRLKKFLYDTSLLEKEIIDNNYSQAEEKKKDLSNLLIKKDLLSQEDINKLEAYILGVPFVDLSDAEVGPEIWSVLDVDFIVDHQIIPYKRRYNALEVAMVNPVDYETIDKMREKSGYYILPRLITKESFVSVVNRLVALYQKTNEGKEGNNDGGNEELQRAAKKQMELVGLAEEKSIDDIVNTILRNAFRDRATEIHIDPDDKELYVRYRVDKKLSNPFILPGRLSPILSAKFKIMADLDIAEVKQPQDGRFKFDESSIRVSMIPVFNGEKITIRPSRSVIQNNLKNVDMRRQDREAIKNVLDREEGVILVAGKSKSGKTTTLYSMLNDLDTLDKNIATIEDSIDSNISRINQTQINEKKGLDFKSALQAHIKQDPDVIMIDELKKPDEVKAAFQAAMPGRMIMGSIPGNDSIDVLKSLIQMGVKRFYIAAALNMIVSKQTVRSLCPECKVKRKLTDFELDELSNKIPKSELNKLLFAEGVLKSKDQSIKDIFFYKPRGCKFCGKTGYKGLLGLYEIMQISDEIEEYLEEEDWYSEKEKILKVARKEGMLTLFEDGVIKAANGETSIIEIMQLNT